MNSALEEARHGSWLDCIHTILDKTVTKISKLRDKWRNSEHGVNPTIEHKLRGQWKKVDHFQVVSVQRENVNFMIKRTYENLVQSPAEYNLSTTQRMCSCGKWQEYNYPCIDALAWLKQHEGRTIDFVLTHYVSNFHTFEYEKEFLMVNINPVCRQNIKCDGVTFPPKELEIKRTGRPKTKRLRCRPAPPNPNARAEKPKCRKCGRTGHNIRTCAEHARKRKEARRMRRLIRENMTGQPLRLEDDYSNDSNDDESSVENNQAPEVHLPLPNDDEFELNLEESDDNDDSDNDDEEIEQNDDEKTDPFDNIWRAKSDKVGKKKSASNDNDAFAIAFNDTYIPPDIATRAPRTTTTTPTTKKKRYPPYMYRNENIF
jgi:hypothetical protein